MSTREAKLGGREPKVWKLERGENESPHIHRGFLLYCMMDSGVRGRKTTVAKAVGRSNPVILDWEKRYKWSERIAAEGPLTVQARACQLYRELYYGRSVGSLEEVAMAERHMSVPFLMMGPPIMAPQALDPLPEVDAETPAEGGEAPLMEDPFLVKVPRRSPGPVEQTVIEREKSTKLDNPKARDSNLVFYRKSMTVLEAGVAKIAMLLAQKDGHKILGLKIGDFPRLLKEHRELGVLLGEVDPPQAPLGIAALAPSYRVQLAQREGRSVTEALLEDVEEVRLALASMVEQDRSETARKRTYEEVSDGLRAAMAEECGEVMTATETYVEEGVDVP